MHISTLYSVEKKSLDKKAQDKKNPDSTGTNEPPIQATRETVESIVVAFILAFLFRAFVAEAFVIPTGSMAPTLMGAHKDLVCEHCGKQYQSSASQEFDLSAENGFSIPFLKRRNADNRSLTNRLMVGSSCPICRGLNAFDLKNNANHGTFSGDRILVSKFDYVMHNPERWDVIVFKFPKNARMNYIKRLVGLPGEDLLIKGGDVFVKQQPDDNWQIARKPPHKIKAMRQVVSDTQYQPRELIEAGWPSLWQPWSEKEKGARWQVEHQPGQWSASLNATDSTEWLRYYHKFLTTSQWEEFINSKSLPPTEATSSRLITDFTAYNSSYYTDRWLVYDRKTGALLPSMQGELRPLEALSGSQVVSEVSGEGTVASAGTLNDSEHWVGDLVGDFDVTITGTSGQLSLLLVENGIRFICEFDIASGKATLRAFDQAQALPIFGQAEARIAECQASTSVTGSGSYHLEMANFDDEITVWVNGKPIAFEQPTTYDLADFRNAKDLRPQWQPQDPLDAAPVAIGGHAVQVKVDRARVWRDIYYIAINGGYSDYNFGDSKTLMAAIPDVAARDKLSNKSGREAVSTIYANPQWWSATSLFRLRGESEFSLEEGQYFPMGDNSGQSLDARAWTNHHYVEHRFMLGKALFVFWPHSWNQPIPGIPNFARMNLIR